MWLPILCWWFLIVTIVYYLQNPMIKEKAHLVGCKAFGVKAFRVLPRKHSGFWTFGGFAAGAKP